jgi:serralysin
MPAVTSSSLSSSNYVNGVLGDYKWATTNLTFSFPTSGSYYGSSYGSSENTTGFGAFSSTQKEAARKALAMYAAVSNLSFSEVAETSSTHGDLRFAMSNKPSTAWAYLPSTAAEGGDSWFNKSGGYYTSPIKGNYAFMTFMHEIGHALGLEHAHEGNVMPTSRDSMEYTVMSYRSYVGGSTTSGYTNESWGYAQSLMMYDIAAIQRMYGANFSTNSGSTVYKWSPTTGEMFINGVGQGAPGGNQIFLTVWDGGGNDTFDFSNYGDNLNIDLRPGYWSTTSSAQLAKLHYNGSEVAVGNIANALLYNDNPRSLIENATGGTGNDKLVGNQAANTLRGGAGNDHLIGHEGNDRLFGGAGADRMDGGAGDDRAEYADARSGVRVDLDRPDTNTGIAAGDTLISVEHLFGSKYDDNLRGNSEDNTLYGRGGNDSLVGRGGNDLLIGGPGADLLHGGGGADIFDFNYVSESTPKAQDTIRDFRHGVDRIDLRSIDANVKVGGNQGFSFIGGSSFGEKAGQLRFGGGVLSGDVDGDGIADFQVAVSGVSKLYFDDFYL